ASQTPDKWQEHELSAPGQEKAVLDPVPQEALDDPLVEDRETGRVSRVFRPDPFQVDVHPAEHPGRAEEPAATGQRHDRSADQPVLPGGPPQQETAEPQRRAEGDQVGTEDRPETQREAHPDQVAELPITLVAKPEPADRRQDGQPDRITCDDPAVIPNE